MTTSFIAPNAHHGATPHPDAPTVVRPQLTHAAVPPATASAPTWKGGWIVSGLAMVLAVAALGTAGGVAFGLMTETHPATKPVATSVPAAPAPVLISPAATASPAAPEVAPAPTRSIGATRTVFVPAPITAAAPTPPVTPVADPIATPPKPVTPPAPPLGIGICDLVACDPKPPTKPAKPPTPPTNCGDLVACQPLP